MRLPRSAAPPKVASFPAADLQRPPDRVTQGRLQISRVGEGWFSLPRRPRHQGQEFSAPALFRGRARSQAGTFLRGAAQRSGPGPDFTRCSACARAPGGLIGPHCSLQPSCAGLVPLDTAPPPREPILTLPGALTAYVALLAVIHLHTLLPPELDYWADPAVRLHSQSLRFDAADGALSRRHRRRGLDLRQLFAAARQSQPHRVQRAVAAAVRQRLGAAVRRAAVLRLHGGDRGGRRAGASGHPRTRAGADDRRLGLGVRRDGGGDPLRLRAGQLPVVPPRRRRRRRRAGSGAAADPRAARSRACSASWRSGSASTSCSGWDRSRSAAMAPAWPGRRISAASSPGCCCSRCSIRCRARRADRSYPDA